MTDQTLPQSRSDEAIKYESGYHGHGRGVVVTQPRAGEFEERPMTQAELLAREPAYKIASEIYRHANQAGACYYEFWTLIAKAIQSGMDTASETKGEKPPRDPNIRHPRLFYYEDTEDAWAPADGLEVESIVGNPSELDADEEREIRFKRMDMSDAEMDALPEV